MRRLLLTFALSAAFLVAGALVPERDGTRPAGAPLSTDCCDVRA